MMKNLFLSSLAAVSLIACSGTEDGLSGRRGPDDGTQDGTTDGTGGGETVVPQCAKGVPHIGFGNTDFVAERVDAQIGADRRRVKPYTALTGDFQRVLGQVPANLTKNAGAFGSEPARWVSEPLANAVSLYSTYAGAFSGCYDTMTDPKFTQAPTEASAATECSTLQRKAWSRTPTTEEIDSCKNLAVQGLTSEADARRRWAHVCASILSSAGFTTY